tara:strand:+ start:462 stop:686 length:225 start_codon:yes stop_codon:yes gene_type:complete
MSATQQELVTAVRAHAIENYEKGGWDFLVECYSDDEIVDLISGARTESGAIKKCANLLGALDARRQDVISSGEW